MPADLRVKTKESEKIDKYLELARELKKLWNMKAPVVSVVAGALEMDPKDSAKGTRRIGNQRKNCDYPDHSIVEIGQNSQKKPGDLR